MTETNEVGSVSGHDDGQGLSFRGLYEVFLKPAAFFEELKDHPRILVPYIVLGIVVVAFFYGTLDYMVRLQLEIIQEQGTQLPPNFDTTPLEMSTFIGGSIAFLLAPLLAAGLALFVGNVLFAGNARFKSILSVMLYGEIVFALGFLLSYPLIVAKDSMLVSFSLAAVLPEQDPRSVVWLALSKIGLFNVWEIIVIGIGLSAVYKFTRNKGYLLAVLSMGLLSVLHVIMTAIAPFG